MRKWILFSIFLFIVVILTDISQANYDYSTGRWLQRDPLGYVDGMNLYEYVESNPVKNFDSNGLSIIPPGLGLIWEWACCSCLVYSEAGRRGQDCMTPVWFVMRNRQSSSWPDFRGEQSFCRQSHNRGKFEGGAGSTRYDSCFKCPWPSSLGKLEREEIEKAKWICLGGSGNNDPTGGAQYFFSVGKAPGWMKKQEAKGNCVRVNVPNCSVLEFWKCKSRPLAQ